jgi:uncharacterized membrane-anchored protein YjiN (DUF445 family)
MEINTNELMLNAIVKETAAKVVNSLDENTKKEVITNAIARILEDMRVSWEVQKIIEEDAKKFAREYIKLPSSQEKIKKKVLEATEEVMNGLAQAIAKDIQHTIKSEYSSWIKER